MDRRPDTLTARFNMSDDKGETRLLVGSPKIKSPDAAKPVVADPILMLLAPGGKIHGLLGV